MSSAVLRELALRGISAMHRLLSPSFTRANLFGEYFANVLVKDVLLVELKCVERLASKHIAQCLNYLRASGRTVCLFVQEPMFEWKRIVQGYRDQPS